MKKSLLISIPLIMFLAACGGSTGSPSASAGSDKPSIAAQNIDNLPQDEDLRGKWVTADPDKDAKFEAIIADGHIRIDWSGDEEGDSALYWIGTFPTDDLSSIVSQGDVEKMKNALLASESKTKTFSYKNGQIIFPFSIAGVNSSVHLKKVS